METVEVETTELGKIIGTSGLEPSKGKYLLDKFNGFFAIADDWKKKAASIVVTSAEQKAEMQMARTGRLFLREKRLEVEKARKELKEESLRESQTIDSVAKVLKNLIEPIESYLDKQEHFVEIREEEEREARKAKRSKELESLGMVPALYDLKSMSEDVYRRLVDGERKAIQDRKDAEAKAETDRIERERRASEERERMRAENARLAKEAEAERQKTAKAKADAEAREQKLKSEQQVREKKLKAEQDALLEKKRKENEKLQAELKAKADAEAREQKQREDEERKAARAPDKKKLIALAVVIESIEMPEVKSAEVKKVLSDAQTLLAKTSKFVREQAAKL